MAQVLVTGATGLLGNNVVRLLLERGQSVRVLVRDGSDPRPLEGLDVEAVHGDIRDPLGMQRSIHRRSLRRTRSHRLDRP